MAYNLPLNIPLINVMETLTNQFNVEWIKQKTPRMWGLMVNHTMIPIGSAICLGGG
jgi:hypothetical protein